MADDSEFHRTLYGGMRKLPYVYMEVRRSVFEGAGAFTGHVFENRSIVPFITRLNKGQDFKKFATDWEKTYSRLCLKTGFGAEPVVDGKMLVVGHYGWFSGDAIFAKVDPNAKVVPSAFEDFLKAGTPVFVRDVNSSSQMGRRVGVSDQSWRVITGITGEVLGFTQYKNRDGAISTLIQPFDLIAIGKLVYALGKQVAGKTLSTLARRRAAREAADVTVGEVAGGVAAGGAARQTGKIGIEEMQQYLDDILVENIELRTLMAARNLEGEALKKETIKALEQWQYNTGKTVQFVEKDVVSKLTRTYPKQNLLSLQKDVLMVEKQALDNAKVFYNEAVHEMSAFSLAGRGGILSAKDIPHIGQEFRAGITDAMSILENAIKNTGSVRRILDSFR